MGKLNEEQIRGVWQRVQAERQTMAETPDLLAMREQQVRRWLLQLSRRSKNPAVLRKMAAQCGQSARVLQGMCVLGAIPAQTGGGTEYADALLRRCYGELLRLCREYEQRSTDPQFGPVFRSLAEEKQRQCRILLSLV